MNLWFLGSLIRISIKVPKEYRENMTVTLFVCINFARAENHSKTKDVKPGSLDPNSAGASLHKSLWFIFNKEHPFVLCA